MWARASSCVTLGALAACSARPKPNVFVPASPRLPASVAPAAACREYTKKHPFDAVERDLWRGDVTGTADDDE